MQCRLETDGGNVVQESCIQRSPTLYDPYSVYPDKGHNKLSKIITLLVTMKQPYFSCVCTFICIKVPASWTQ